MKNKIVLMILAVTLAISGCGSTSKPVSTESASAESQNESDTDDSQVESSDLDALGDVEVEKELFDVTINIPSDYISATTQEELDEAVAELGCKATLNEDGSATYVMTKQQHKKLMDDMANNINTALNEMIESEDYPNITDVSANSDFTEFTVTTKNTEPDLSESLAVMGFYMYGGMYHIFDGTEVDNIHVDYVNADSGEVISSADSADMGSN